MQISETRYARSGDVHIAYQVTGDGPFDLVQVPAFVSHVEAFWQVSPVADMIARLSSFCRLIRFDKRGTGMSDRVAGVPTLETRMDDLRAVMDGAGSERAAILGASEGGPMSILFTATYPDRVWALILAGTFPRVRWAADYPWGTTEEEERRDVEETERRWGSAEYHAEIAAALAPSAADTTRRALAAAIRQSASPGAAVALKTILFTDIVGATQRAAALGDRGWRELLERHHAVVRRELLRFRGRELDTAGDGFFASFDGPARAIRCAQAIAAGVRELGLEIRAGLHTGECERTNGKLAGIAVHIGARVASAAGPGEVLVSGTVKDLVAGSGIEFADRGEHALKGLSGEWRLFAASA